MGPTPDHKEEDLRREKSSLPIPSKSEKLLTLPTILTIGRVAAVPLLVTSKFLSYIVDLITVGLHRNIEVDAFVSHALPKLTD